MSFTHVILKIIVNKSLLRESITFKTDRKPIELFHEQVTNMTGPPWNIWMFCITIEDKSSCNTFIFTEYIAKILQTSYFMHFGHIWPLPSKMIMPTCRNFNVYLHAKNELHSELLFSDIVKILQTWSTLRMLDRYNQ